jgi:hypothetical protein
MAVIAIRDIYTANPYPQMILQNYCLKTGRMFFINQAYFALCLSGVNDEQQ